MILPDVRTVFALDAFTGDAGSDHFGQPVIVDGVQVESVLDLCPHSIGPRLRAAHRNLERALPRIDALGMEFIEDCKHVAGGDENDVRLEISDQPHLPLGHATRHRHDRHAQPFSAVVKRRCRQ